MPPLQRKDLHGRQGDDRVIPVKSEALGLLASGSGQFLLGCKTPTGRPDEFTKPCKVCQGAVTLGGNDKAKISRHHDIVIICDECFFSMEAEEVKGEGDADSSH